MTEAQVSPILDLIVRQLEDSFALAPDAQAICVRLIEEVDAFAHLGQALFACVLSQPLVSLRGDECNALVGVPTMQGPFKRMSDWMFAQVCAPVLDWEEPDFLVLIDAAVWSTLDAVRQERLMFHELKHVVARENEYGVPKLDAEGRPMLRLQRHDEEFFHDEVTRYGAHVCGLEDAALAIADGIRKDRRDALTESGKTA